jgi:hypothetical protein
VGHELVPHDDDAVVTFRDMEEFEDFQWWLKERGWTRAPNFEAMMKKIKDALS